VITFNSSSEDFRKLSKVSPTEPSGKKIVGPTDISRSVLAAILTHGYAVGPTIVGPTAKKSFFANEFIRNYNLVYKYFTILL